MIVPDVNLLVYAYNLDAPGHEAARRWWEDTLSGTGTVGLAWVVCLGYVRLMTNRAVMTEPWSPVETVGHVRSWMERPQVQVIQPGPRHIDILQGFAEAQLVSTTLVTDAHVAALAIEHQAVVHSNDADFDRFPGLRRFNPLAARG